MPSETDTSHGSQPPSDDAERKLWFEYLAKLNDRDLQSARASGFTPWALLAVAAAIVYKATPEIPGFLSIVGGVKTAAITLLLEVDAVSLLAMSVVGMLFYCAPAIQARSLPEHNRRAARMKTWVSRTLTAAVVAGHVLAVPVVTCSKFVQWALGALGLFWLWNLLFGIRKELKKSREAKRHKLPLPAFRVGLVGPGLGSLLFAALLFPFAALAARALFVFIHTLQVTGFPWLAPLGAASDGLGLAVVMLALFFRAVDAISRGTFLALERDVILECLSPSEIKHRFIREVLGPSVGDWLQTLNQSHRDGLSKIAALTESINARALEVEAIDANFSLERSGRAQKLLEELDAGVNSYVEALEGFLFQVQQVIKEVSPATWETGILTRLTEQFQAEQAQRTGALKSARELRSRLQAIAKPPK